MKKKILSILVCAAAIFAVAPTAVFAADDVAKIGDTTYESLSAAVTAAKSGETIILIKDHTEEVTNVLADDNIIIDLNSKTLSGRIFSKGVMTVKNGTIVNTNKDESGIESNGASANLTVENLKITSVRHALRIDGGAATINSGHYETNCTTNTTVYGLNASSQATVVINGGKFYGSGTNGKEASAAAQFNGNGGLYIVNGGEFYSNGGSYTLSLRSDSITIKGGIFDKASLTTYLRNPSTLTKMLAGGKYEEKPGAELIADGYIVEETEDGWYRVFKPVAYIVGGSKHYDSIEAAAADAKDGDTIQVLTDIVNSTVQLGDKDLTLQLGQYTFIGEIFINDEMALIIEGGSDKSDIKVTPNGEKAGFTLEMTEELTDEPDGATYTTYETKWVEKIANPATGDSVVFALAALIASVFGLAGTAVLAKK